MPRRSRAWRRRCARGSCATSPASEAACSSPTQVPATARSARAKAALGEKSAHLIEVDYARVAGDLLTVPYHGLPGRARALRAVLSAARDLGARGCVVLDGGLRSIEPEWIAALAGPVLRDNFDYVSPYYLRHPCEGALTKGIVYPLFRALYGVPLRQPTAGEFGCSARLIEAYLDDDLLGA